MLIFLNLRFSESEHLTLFFLHTVFHGANESGEFGVTCLVVGTQAAQFPDEALRRLVFIQTFLYTALFPAHCYTHSPRELMTRNCQQALARFWAGHDQE